MKKLFIRILIPALLFTACRGNTENKNYDKTDSVEIAKSSTDKNKIHKNIHIMAKPDSIAIDASRTAVIVVDMQNDFAAKGGMYDRAGFNISMIQKVIDPTAKVLAAARQVGIKIIYLKMGYHEGLSDLGSEESVSRMRLLKNRHFGDTISAPNGSKSRILIRDTWNTDIVPELKPHADDIVIYKTRFSGFYQTDLDSILKKLGKKYIIVTGCTTSICVESTVRDAMFRDYLAVVLEDCTAEPIGNDLPRSNHEASLLIIQKVLGWVSSSDEFIKVLKEQPISNNQKLQ
jgi:ureidoacrylate peracid hydrolase